MSERFREVISSKAKKEIELIGELDKLFRQLEEGKLEDEERIAVGNEIRDKLKQYRQLCGKEVEDEIKEYYNRLEKFKKIA